MSTQLQLLLVLVLLLMSAFFSSSETALFSLNRLRLKRKQEKNPLDSWFVAKLLEHPRRLLQVILFGNEMVNTAFAVLIAGLFYELLHDKVPGFLEGLIPVLVAMPLVIIVGEIIPKAIAVRIPEQVARLNAPLLNFMTLLIRPALKIIDPFVSWMIRSVFRTPHEIRFEAAQTLDEETLRSMVDLGHSEGEVQQSEKEFIHRVLELDDVQVRQMMTPRHKMVALDIDTPLREAVERIRMQRFSRIPVYRDTLDRVAGMLYTKDLLRLVKGEAREIRSLMRPVYFVPHTRKVSEVLRDFQEQHIHIAVVVDEYGKPVGLITLQDILDRLFGDAYHEARPAAPSSEGGA